MPREGSFVYVIPLKRVYWGRRSNRADRAVKFIRLFIKRHTKANAVIITNEVNNYIWSRGRQKPPRRVKVLVTLEEREKEEEEKRVAIVRLAGEKLKPGPYKPKSKK